MVFLAKLRAGLDRLYLVSGALGAVFLIAILSLIVLQMVARWTGEVFPGAAEYVGYCMAAASFFAFAHTLQRGAHIRVSMLLNVVPAGVRRILEIWCFAIGAALAWYFVWYATKFVYWSWKFKDISQGQDATLLWMPQPVWSSALSFGDLSDRFSFIWSLPDSTNVHEPVDPSRSRVHGRLFDYCPVPVRPVPASWHGRLIGLALLGVAFVGMELYVAPGRRCDDHHRGPAILDAGCPADVHLDGRGAVPRAVGGHVPWAAPWLAKLLAD